MVLDTSAVFRYLDRQEGAMRVAEILEGRAAGDNRVVISSVHWGEVAYLLHKRRGLDFMNATLQGLLAIGIEVVEVSVERAVRSGIIKAQTGVPYVDAFGVELASESSEHLLLTADFDATLARQDVAIEFLPIKAKPN
jgi:PIN domain nuclease of toxin-antitoxin system